MDFANGLDEEARRLATLCSLDLLDTAPEAEFDMLVALAARLLDCPAGMLTLIDRDRLWVKAREGEGPTQIPRQDAMCDHTIQGTAPLMVEDLAADPRFAANPHVVAPGGMRFYAGVPLHVEDEDGARQAIGAVCVIDHRPRRLSAAELDILERLARIAEALIAARAETRRAMEIARERERHVAALSERDRTLRQAERIAQIGAWRYDLLTDRLDWSEGAYLIHAVDRRPMNVRQALDHYAPGARARVSAALARTIETGAAMDVEEDISTARGERRRLHATAELESVDGRPVAVIGVIQDVTDRYALEMQLRRAADTDALTGIANRAAFDRLLDEALARHRDAGAPLLLALVDLDGFKLINDTFGHPAGDDVLRICAEALRAPWLLGSVPARLGGDEFAVIVDHPELCAAPDRLRARLENALHLPVAAGGVTVMATGTVGIAAASDLHGASELVRRADTDLYAAKRARLGQRLAG